MSDWNNNQAPLDFVRNIWGNMGFSLPGMVAPTLDTDELSKRISDLKAVEGWLRMNLSMLTMTIQNLEMQRTTLSAVQAMSQMASEATAQAKDDPEAAQAFSQAAMWPWNLMQQMQDQFAQAGAAPGATEQPAPPAAGAPGKPTGSAASAAAKAGSKRRKEQ